jgi:hypothetical protein
MLGHLHPTRIVQLRNNRSITGLFLRGEVPTDFRCDVRFSQNALPPVFASDWGATAVGQVLHCDVCGKIQLPSLANNNYFILIIDDHTEYQFVKIAQKKSEAAEFIILWFWFGFLFFLSFFFFFFGLVLVFVLISVLGLGLVTV